MSTANEPTTAQPQTTETPVLDSVIEATQKRQDIGALAAANMGVSPANVCEVLRGIWKTSNNKADLTKHEMFVGLSMIARYELDPVAKEVYVTRSSKGLMTIVGVDGWIKILHRTPYFDGFEQDEIRDDNGEVTTIITTIYSKTHSHPFRYKALMSEYRKVSGDVAKIMPVHMLGIFSLRHAARMFVPLSGVMMPEEAQYTESSVPASEPQSLAQLAADSTPEPPPTQPVDDTTPAERLAEYLEQYDECGEPEDGPKIEEITDRAKADPVLWTAQDQKAIKDFERIAMERIGGDT